MIIYHHSYHAPRPTSFPHLAVDEFSDALCRCMGAVRRTKGVVDVKVTQRRQLLAELLIVALQKQKKQTNR